MLRKDFPDHHDAELVLRLYDLRRETVMRESRARIMRDFWPATADELLAVARTPDHPLNAPFRQCSTYWEMAYNFARQGVVHADFLVESNGGEGLFLFARVEPHLPALREAINPAAFRNAEWVATECAAGRALMERFRGRVRAMHAQRAAPAAG